MSAQLQVDGAERFVPMDRDCLNAVIAIELDLYPFPWTRGNFEDSLQAGYGAWTLRDDRDHLLGYCVFMLAVDEMHLLNLSVARTHQRQGLGGRMLAWVVQRAREHRAQAVILEVRPSNEGAQRLYARFGFEHIGWRRGYYPAHSGREDAEVMRLGLRSS